MPNCSPDEATVDAGQFLIMGRPLDAARAQGIFGCAIAPNEVPKHWAVRRVLELAAQMAGNSVRGARACAARALETVGEPALLKRQWTRASPIEQALATLALGIINEPQLLYVTLPMGQFESGDGLRYASALERASTGRALVVQVERLPQQAHEAAWLNALESVSYVFDEQSASTAGVPDGRTARYLLRVAGDAAGLAAELLNVGINVVPIHSPHDAARGRCALLVDVPRSEPGTVDTSVVLDACVNSNLTIIALLPV